MHNQDIDVLLTHGEDKPKSMTEEFLQNQQTTLANFKLVIEDANIYEFEGVNYSDIVPTKSVVL